ncbi:ribosome-binding factor A [Nitrosococcus oceani ATCC 19707]|uniref:Ribosome-binding factor A n=2 Tax=Nitrosococcus oceani TaxID=1229 RepID=RBFA_NITOC|nr:30S ribosome-binding factor RbfA [Nitrosococcus oceani]Q3J9B7.1 RecName: Full=Ribosome-binding factor A [Nitrosococcus oceani ATCC 19707]KFI19002.1 ribosome-binding factor A [Nitrosococcus oceani C-27]ABA58579.1 ribosome-binding factor A [Nitrosococcus oceani ATCC 19707]EDZ67449.1 ribosome-binding factor A [Nitrosococcus oceani AFC27]GEM19698.1 ribosome-binding factor A [Nitrosococcus oceani]
MSQEFSRARRVGELLQRELARLFQEELKDPRVKLVTVSHVRVSPDLRQAKAYVTFLGKEEDTQEQLAVLNKAAGFLQHGLSQRVELRVIPRLQFVYDDSIERGRRLSALIDKAVQKETDGESDNSTE